MGRVSGKTIILTGAAGGIGSGDARLLAGEGGDLVLVDVDEARVGALAQDIEASGGHATGVVADVATVDGWEHVVSTAVDTYGGVDVLVNNAAALRQNDITVESADDFHFVIGVNLLGPFLGMQRVIPEMRKRGGGSIVNIASIAALAGGPASDGGDAAYAASKGGLRSLAKHAAERLAADSIPVNTIFPGSIDTERSRAARASLGTQAPGADVLAQRNPLPPHRGEPNDIAYAVLYFASDESKYATGAELVVDGGYTVK
jgi:cyclopentanol dehydrogenase